MARAPAAISVIIPTHLRHDRLKIALQSALGQSHAPSEILVVDDVGDERTERAVQMFASRTTASVRYIVNIDSGPSSSRNLGASAAVGSVLAFLDDDDVWGQRYLEQAVSLLVEAEVAVTPLIKVTTDETGKELRRERGSLRAGDPRRVLDRIAGVTGSNLVISRDTFERHGGYDEQLWMGEDFELFCRLLNEGARIVVAPEHLATFTIHSGPSLTRDLQRTISGLALLTRRVHKMVSTSGQLVLASRYFRVKSDIADSWLDSFRYSLYSWSYVVESKAKLLERRCRSR